MPKGSQKKDYSNREKKRSWSYVDGKIVVQSPPNEVGSINKTYKKPKRKKVIVAGEKLFLSYRDYLNSQQWMTLRKQAVEPGLR